ncbi:deoxynucleoside triphosphate triphosphohydrolase SAMHD1-like isoform X2 [Oreochromis aureus]|uniref:deoxynucleoside triphosphate triphosphohydrolase SAMHD1-like isoform X2 n=1 Tax=Oreochromis aureus TaxID=47969 RepID=UPI001953E49D|nr:deoxynucleoside triphosphate triphosphohydrolase SAMHD1-like isoform X2 [Oreochromis aureus]
MENQQDTKERKVFYDPIHGLLELHPLLVKIIDTPQFQRLRNIKQLGGAYFVFPGASHNRFEHSLGVAYLAGQFAEALSTKQPELNITPEDILCVQIAGLCQDLGQGPFSIVFEEMFIREKRADLPDGKKREKISVQMFDYLLTANNLHSSMKEYGLNVDGQNKSDLVFIKEMIGGPLNTTETQEQFMGRTQDKYFLYEIVENEKNGIDVDKFDYIARDGYYLGIQSSFDHRRCLMFARVCRVDGINHICFRDKEVSNLYSMFQTRSLLHRTAYQHKTTRIIEVMIKDALLKAGECIQIEGSKGKICSLSTAIDDMEAYTKLTDSVFEKILHSSERPDAMIQMLEHELGTDPSILFKGSSLSPTEENMETYKKMKVNIITEAINSFSKEMGEAQRLLLKIVSREIYKCLGKMQSEKPTMSEIDTWKKELAQACPPGENVTVTANDFEIVHFTMDYGITEKELIENVFFYKKNQHDKPFNLREDEVSMLLPKCSSEQFIRVYYKNIDEEIVETAQEHFDQWLSEST